MSSAPSPGAPQPGSPLAAFEYELTDELAFAAAWALYERRTAQVKANLARSGAPHPAVLPLAASAMIVVAVAAAVVLAWESVLTRVLIVVAFFTLLVLLFRTALYFHEPFARWYVRRKARRMTRRLSPRTIGWTLYDDRLETKSAVLQRAVLWKDVIAIERLGDYSLLRLRDGTELFAPRMLMPPEVQAALRHKAVQAGAALNDGDPEPGSGHVNP